MNVLTAVGIWKGLDRSPAWKNLPMAVAIRGSVL